MKQKDNEVGSALLKLGNEYNKILNRKARMESERYSFQCEHTLSERRNNHIQSFENCTFLYHWSCAAKQEKIWQSTIIKKVLCHWPPQLLTWLTCRNFLHIDWLLRMRKLLHGLRCSALNIEQCRAELHEIGLMWLGKLWLMELKKMRAIHLIDVLVIQVIKW